MNSKLRNAFISFVSCICLFSCTNFDELPLNKKIETLEKDKESLITVAQCKNQYYIKRDTVYNRSDNKPFTGKLSLLGRLKYPDPDGSLIEKETIVAFFNITNGVFTGKQIYSPDEKGIDKFPYYLEWDVIPNMDMIEDIDFKVIKETYRGDTDVPDKYDLMFYLPFQKVFVEIINKKKYNPAINLYWLNGNLFTSCHYKFDPSIQTMQAYSKWYDDKLLVSGPAQIKMNHYNGNQAYDGWITGDKGETNMVGKFYGFSGNPIDSANFYLPMGPNSENVAAKDLSMWIDNEIIWSYRNFFMMKEEDKYWKRRIQ